MTSKQPPSILRRTKEGHRLYISMRNGEGYCADEWQLDQESGWLFLPLAFHGMASHRHPSTNISVDAIESFYVQRMASHKVQKSLNGMEPAPDDNETA